MKTHQAELTLEKTRTARTSPDTIAPAQLILNRTTEELKVGDLADHTNNGYTIIENDEHLKFALENRYKKVDPYLVSPVEKPKEGDLVFKYDVFNSGPKEYDPQGAKEDMNKQPLILALPDQFSEFDLKRIVDREMNQNTNLFVRCQGHRNFNLIPLDSSQVIHGYMVHLNEDGHVIISIVKEAVEEFIERYLDEMMDPHATTIDQISHAIKSAVEWAKK